MSVFDANAEAKRTNRPEFLDAVDELLHDLASPNVRGGEQRGETVDVIPLSAFPRNVAEVESVVDPVVGERGQVVLIDRVPQAEFGGDAVTEPLQHSQAIGPFWCRGQAEQLHGCEVLKQAFVRFRCRVVELVDDDHIEAIGCEVVEIRSGERLDRREDVVELCGGSTASPLLPEVRIA